MNHTSQDLTGQYASALQDHLAEESESALQRAYELGRKAIERQLGVLGLAAIHQEALVLVLLRTVSPEESARTAKRATQFFLESLAPFEMTQRGFQEANALLRNLNESLRHQAAELSAANQELQKEISERKRAEQETQEVNAELAAANRELEAFTSSVAHDLRAPLRHINGFSQILLEQFGPGLDPSARHYLERIQQGAARMANLVDDLLNLARVARQELNRQVTGLNSLVREVLADLKPEMESREIDWKIGQLPFVDCDPSLMKQVLANLLSNAIKFTRPRPRACIEVDRVTQNGEPVVFVRDNGVGFSMKYADKLFGVFQRLHRQEDFSGTGVGLATVQRIIHKHGGRIWAEAELNRGATFYFTLGAPVSQQPVNAQVSGIKTETSQLL